MTDFSFFGMIIGIIVLFFAFFIIAGAKTLEAILTPIGNLIDHRRIKQSGYYDLPASPEGFFSHYFEKYKRELLMGDFARVPYGKDREFLINIKGRCSVRKESFLPYAEEGANILASCKEIEKGYRPTYFMIGQDYKSKEAVWLRLRAKYTKDYDWYNKYLGWDSPGQLQSIIDAQKAKEQRFDNEWYKYSKRDDSDE